MADPEKQKNKTVSANDEDSKENKNNKKGHNFPNEQLDYRDDGQGHRIIGKWYIRETLGKGGYSWVKRGVDVNTGKNFALKFMERRYKDANKNELRESQIRAVQTEIDILKRVGKKSSSIIRLFAYNLNQKYPDRGGKGSTRDVILLVLEYAACGDLFDLLYYTETMPPILARTYFQQLISGISCLHSLGIIHRDIKPQNLLLDGSYTLKITDFGLSKIININKFSVLDVKLANYKVGTRGYQAPEIAHQMGYNALVDVFACGVVLFMIMTGYPPFKTATKEDKWYQYIAKGDYMSFWKAHRNCGLKRRETDLVSRMLCFNAAQRIGIDKIMQHPWYNDNILNGDQLQYILTQKHREMNTKRGKDALKKQILQNSEHVKVRPILPVFLARIIKAGYTKDALPPTLPKYENPAPWDVYTTNPAFEVLQEIEYHVKQELRGMIIDPNCNEIFEDENVEKGADGGDGSGGNDNGGKQCEIDIENFCLAFKVAYIGDAHGINGCFVHVQLFYVAKYNCNLVKFTRIKADKKDFKRVLKALVTRLTHVLNGLPDKFKSNSKNNDMNELYNKVFPVKEAETGKEKEKEKQ